MSLPVIGVDPGVRGGVALLAGDGTVIGTWALRPEMTQREAVMVVVQAAHQLATIGGYHAFMEKVGVMPTDGRRGANTFGRVDGLLRGAAFACGLEVHDVPPFTWQAALDCLTAGDKNVTKRRAIALFPSTKITHSVADALLIAEYGRRRLAL